MSKARDALRRAAAKLPAGEEPAAGDRPSTGELRTELADTRARLRATRARLKSARAELAETRARLTDALERIAPPELPDGIDQLIDEILAEQLSLLTARNLRALAATVADIETQGVPGLFVEAGTALGGSAIVLAATKAPSRRLVVYDVFGLIPEPGKRDGADVHDRYQVIAAGGAHRADGETYYGYRADLLGEVTASFARYGYPVEESGVSLVKGLFADTVHLDEPVAFAHLDGDWYESTMTCLTRIAPLLVPSGRLAIDDYYHWSGCRAAVDEYFAGRPEFRLEHREKLQVLRLP